MLKARRTLPFVSVVSLAQRLINLYIADQLAPKDWDVRELLSTCFCPMNGPSSSWPKALVACFPQQHGVQSRLQILPHKWKKQLKLSSMPQRFTGLILLTKKCFWWAYLKWGHYRHISGCFHSITTLSLLTGVLMGITAIQGISGEFSEGSSWPARDPAALKVVMWDFSQDAKEVTKISKITGFPGTDSQSPYL